MGQHAILSAGAGDSALAGNPLSAGLPLLRALLLLLFAAAFAPRPRVYLLSFVAFAAVYSLWDQTRWQPWVYQYWLMLLALGCYSWKSDDVVGERDALNICRLIMGCTYFYSGLQKMNVRFVTEGFPWVLNTLHIHVPGLGYLGWVAAAIEVSIGLSLLTRRFRKIGMINGVIMHIFILYSFGPWGRDWNSVVWPWNVIMIALILLLFSNCDATFGELVWRNRFVYHKVVLVLFGILPSLSFFGYWPTDLSVALYTANLTEANLLVSDSVKQTLPPEVQPYVKPIPGHHGAAHSGLVFWRDECPALRRDTELHRVARKGLPIREQFSRHSPHRAGEECGAGTRQRDSQYLLRGIDRRSAVEWRLICIRAWLQPCRTPGQDTSGL